MPSPSKPCKATSQGHAPSNHPELLQVPDLGPRTEGSESLPTCTGQDTQYLTYVTSSIHWEVTLSPTSQMRKRGRKRPKQQAATTQAEPGFELRVRLGLVSFATHCHRPV